ncbi:MAG: c-type cytochrome biogenesis protein CcmI [Hydrogenophaga sp.]|nr:c-type cytochrome biogenesis protein CcmI [Hydrogenophaga sp.]
MSADVALFALLAAGLVALTLVALLRALKGASSPMHTPAAGHRAVLQTQWAQLNDDLRLGKLDDTEHARSRDELMQRMLEDEAGARQPRPARHLPATGGTAWALVWGLPLLVLAVYSFTGNPQAVNWRAAEGDDNMGRAEMRDVEEMIGQMAQRLRQGGNQPPDEAAQAWAMVAQSYAGLQRFADAEQAYARASELEPRQPQWLADRADMLAMANGQRTEGEPERLVQRALLLDPTHLKSLALAGSMAYQRQDMVAALDHWRRARAQATEGSGFASELDRSIAAAQASARKQPVPVATEPATATGINGTVRLSPALAQRVSPSDSVFVLVRAIDGPRVPLAVTRHTVADLPLRFELNDSQAMTPEMKLSRFERVEVLVRISRSGNAIPRSGDLFAQSAVVTPRSQGLALVVDREVP